MSEHARGTFDVTITPDDPDGALPGLGRLRIAKVWHGDLTGTGHGLMLSAGDPARQRAGYVALETFEGTLHGRSGSFAFQQLGAMRLGGQELRYDVVPGSGTGDLEGIDGTLELTIADDGTHSYDVVFTLP
jgi:hypothetical protein